MKSTYMHKVPKIVLYFLRHSQSNLFINALPLGHNIKQMPLLNKHPSPHFLNNRDTRKTCFFCHFIDEIIDI